MNYDVSAVRRHFPALDSGVAFFDGPGGTQTPRAVADAIAATLCAPLSNRGTEHRGRAQRRAQRRPVPRRDGRPARRRPAWDRLRPERDAAHLRHVAHAGHDVVTGRRGGGHPPRPRLEHPPVGAGCRAVSEPSHGGSTSIRPRASCRSTHCAPCSDRAPARRRDGRVEPDRDAAARRCDRPPRPRRRRAAVRRRRALHRPRAGRRRRPRCRLLHLLAVQVPRSALRRARRRSRAPRGPRARQAAAVDDGRARALRARHPAVRADGGRGRGCRLPRRARTPALDGTRRQSSRRGVCCDRPPRVGVAGRDRGRTGRHRRYHRLLPSGVPHTDAVGRLRRPGGLGASRAISLAWESTRRTGRSTRSKRRGTSVSATMAHSASGSRRTPTAPTSSGSSPGSPRRWAEVDEPPSLRRRP